MSVRTAAAILRTIPPWPLTCRLDTRRGTLRAAKAAAAVHRVAEANPDALYQSPCMQHYATVGEAQENWQDLQGKYIQAMPILQAAFARSATEDAREGPFTVELSTLSDVPRITLHRTVWTVGIARAARHPFQHLLVLDTPRSRRSGISRTTSPSDGKAPRPSPAPPNAALPHADSHTCTVRVVTNLTRDLGVNVGILESNAHGVALRAAVFSHMCFDDDDGGGGNRQEKNDEHRVGSDLGSSRWRPQEVRNIMHAAHVAAEMAVLPALDAEVAETGRPSVPVDRLVARSRWCALQHVLPPLLHVLYDSPTMVVDDCLHVRRRR